MPPPMGAARWRNPQEAQPTGNISASIHQSDLNPYANPWEPGFSPNASNHRRTLQAPAARPDIPGPAVSRTLVLPTLQPLRPPTPSDRAPMVRPLPPTETPDPPAPHLDSTSTARNIEPQDMVEAPSHPLEPVLVRQPPAQENIVTDTREQGTYDWSREELLAYSQLGADYLHYLLQDITREDKKRLFPPVGGKNNILAALLISWPGFPASTRMSDVARDLRRFLAQDLDSLYIPPDAGPAISLKEIHRRYSPPGSPPWRRWALSGDIFQKITLTLGYGIAGWLHCDLKLWSIDTGISKLFTQVRNSTRHPVTLVHFYHTRWLGSEDAPPPLSLLRRETDFWKPG